MTRASRLLSAVPMVLLTALPLAAADTGKFTSLFDGRTLNGWEVCNGFATYKVDGGAIVGTTAEGSPNSFLCSKEEYGDFILEFEVKVDPALNSGVQIRSHRYPADVTVMTFDGSKKVESKHKAGRVYGYQVEISNVKSGTSGGIYDEARRGWLHNIDKDPAASTAFRDNKWNKYRIEARGDRLRTWVNEVPCADLVDPLDQSGFIGLQVHSYKGEKPAQVRWRNIRIQPLGRHVWKPLTDGKTMNGWTKQGTGNWTIEDGAFRGLSAEGETRAGFLISERSFTDVTARVKFKILKGNSGFFFRAAQANLAGYEAEIDAEKRTGGLWEVAGRNWVTGPEDNAVVNAGDWNDLVVSAQGRRIVIHVNGAKTMELLNDAQGSTQGHLAMQVHSRWPTEVWFKDVEVLEPAQ